MKNYSVRVLAILWCVSLGGCFEDDVVWLPDSSGIVFVRSDGAITRYDLTTMNEKVLLKEDWTANREGFREARRQSTRQPGCPGKAHCVERKKPCKS